MGIKSREQLQVITCFQFWNLLMLKLVYCILKHDFSALTVSFCCLCMGQYVIGYETLFINKHNTKYKKSAERRINWIRFLGVLIRLKKVK